MVDAPVADCITINSPTPISSLSPMLRPQNVPPKNYPAGQEEQPAAMAHLIERNLSANINTVTMPMQVEDIFCDVFETSPDTGLEVGPLMMESKI